MRAAALTNDAALIHHEERWTVQGDPTEGALIVAARKFGLGETELERFPRIAEIPFTSERKRHTTLHLDRETPGELRVFVKGAPEVLLAKSRHIWQDGKAVPLDEQGRAELSRRNDALAGKALRVLAVAMRTCPRPPWASIRPTPKAGSRSNCRMRSRTISCCSVSSE